MARRPAGISASSADVAAGQDGGAQVVLSPLAERLTGDQAVEGAGVLGGQFQPLRRLAGAAGALVRAGGPIGAGRLIPGGGRFGLRQRLERLGGLVVLAGFPGGDPDVPVAAARRAATAVPARAGGRGATAIEVGMVTADGGRIEAFVVRRGKFDLRPLLTERPRGALTVAAASSPRYGVDRRRWGRGVPRCRRGTGPGACGRRAPCASAQVGRPCRRRHGRRSAPASRAARYRWLCGRGA